jgi:hypothetical protein
MTKEPASYLSVGETANELTKELGEPVPQRWISDLFYYRELRNDLCPIIAGRRIIPRSYLPMIVMALRRRGWISRDETSS